MAAKKKVDEVNDAPEPDVDGVAPAEQTDSSNVSPEEAHKHYEDMLAGNLTPGFTVRVQSRGNKVVPIVNKVK